MGKAAKCFAAAFLFAFVIGSPASAAKIEGVSFEKTVTAGNVQLALRGWGLLRYMVVFKAYAGALYLPAGARSAESLTVVPKRLELQYFHAIAAPDLADATRKMIAANVSPETLAALSGRMDRLANIYRGVRPGDRYALTYLPDE